MSRVRESKKSTQMEDVPIPFLVRRADQKLLPFRYVSLCTRKGEVEALLTAADKAPRTGTVVMSTS